MSKSVEDGDIVIPSEFILECLQVNLGHCSYDLIFRADLTSLYSSYAVTTALKRSLMMAMVAGFASAGMMGNVPGFVGGTNADPVRVLYIIADTINARYL